jgi:hypothetical protein
MQKALKRVGGEIVKIVESTNTTVFIRIDSEKAKLWSEAVSEFLLSRGDWNSEVAKVFFAKPEENVVRYLWRVIFKGDIAAATEAFTAACTRAAAKNTELTEFPLVGRKHYEFDPTTGKTAGGRSPAEAQATLSSFGVK